MLQMPSFKAIDSLRGGDSLAVHVIVLRHQGGLLLAVKDVMVLMTFRRLPMGVAHSRSTGKIFFVKQVG